MVSTLSRSPVVVAIYLEVKQRLEPGRFVASAHFSSPISAKVQTAHNESLLGRNTDFLQCNERIKDVQSAAGSFAD